MERVHHRNVRPCVFWIVLLAVTLFAATRSVADHTHTSKPFTGAKANTGAVIHSKDGNKNILTLSEDFQIPDTPDPHWQVVDAQGNVYLLQKLRIKGDKVNKSITLPPYIHTIAKVQIWCAFAETVLGEAAFDTPVH